MSDQETRETAAIYDAESREMVDAGGRPVEQPREDDEPGAVPRAILSVIEVRGKLEPHGALSYVANICRSALGLGPMGYRECGEPDQWSASPCVREENHRGVCQGHTRFIAYPDERTPVEQPVEGEAPDFTDDQIERGARAGVEWECDEAEQRGRSLPRWAELDADTRLIRREQTKTVLFAAGAVPVERGHEVPPTDRDSLREWIADLAEAGRLCNRRSEHAGDDASVALALLLAVREGLVDLLTTAARGEHEVTPQIENVEASELRAGDQVLKRADQVLDDGDRVRLLIDNEPILKDQRVSRVRHG